MPSTESQSAQVPASELHRQRRVAESFGADPERYDRSRPRFPDALAERIMAGIGAGRVLDVGTGTGIVGRQFAAAGAEVLGVDPDPRMAGFARRSGLEVEQATFESWEPAGRRFDAVVSGQTWHWLDPVAGAAKAARILRPGGRLAVFWNAEQPTPELREAFAAVYRRTMPDSLAARQWTEAGLQGYAVLCGRATGGMAEAGAFGEPEQWSFDWERSYTRDEWLDQVPTHGDHGQFPAATQAELLAGIGAALDAAGGGFTMRYRTLVATAVRTA